MHNILLHRKLRMIIQYNQYKLHPALEPIATLYASYYSYNLASLVCSSPINDFKIKQYMSARVCLVWQFLL